MRGFIYDDGRIISWWDMFLSVLEFVPFLRSGPLGSTDNQLRMRVLRHIRFGEKKSPYIHIILQTEFYPSAARQALAS